MRGESISGLVRKISLQGYKRRFWVMKASLAVGGTVPVHPNKTRTHTADGTNVELLAVHPGRKPDVLPKQKEPSSFMIDRIYAHMQAMQVLQKSQDATADNLSNINTPGFKGNKMFYRMFQENVNGREVAKSVPMQQVNMNQGVLEPTGNEFDLGLNGDGFFTVQKDGQSLLTRDGRFHLDPDGFLVNGQGARVMGENGEIQLPEYFLTTNNGMEPELEIAKDGTIRLNDEPVEKLQIVTVDDPANLQRKGSSYFSVANEDMLSTEGTGTVMQGYYEKGNVEPLNEMVDMMQNMQMFESQQRALRTSDELLSRVSTELGKF